MWAHKIKAFFRPKRKIEGKPAQKAEKKPGKPESIEKKQGLNGIIVSQKVPQNCQ